MSKKKPPQWYPNPDPDSIVIPGLDTTAPVPDQVEQIDQLITLKLQKIDAQFARIQWLAENKLLPAVKRYTNGVQPVREAAHFWVQFFEAAARMRVPRQDDYDQEESDQPSVERSDATVSTPEDSSEIYGESPSHRHALFDPNVTPSESSFMPGLAAVSSTPATTSKERAGRKAVQTPSWSSSVESSLNRLSEELDGLAMDETTTSLHSTSGQAGVDKTIRLQSARDTGKGKARSANQPLLRSVLQQNLHNTSDVSSNTSFDIGIPGLSSPLRHDAAKILARMNPYLPPNTQPSQWDSVVNLSNTRLATPKQDKSNFSQTYHEEDSFGSDPGMGLSPPVTIDWGLPTKRQPSVRQTPRKEAAARIGQDLINNIEGRKPIQSTESSLRDLSHTRYRGKYPEVSYSYDSDDPGLGLSPPATIDWAHVPYQKQKDVLGKTGKVGVGAEASSSMSSISSPPSLSRYMDGEEAGLDTASELDLDSLMRRVGLDFEIKSEHSMTEEYSRTTSILAPATGPVHELEPPRFVPPLKTPEQQIYSTIQSGDIVDTVVGIPGAHQDDYNPDLSDSFEDDQPNDTINPSNAFLLASQRRPSFDDDSFGSGDSFSGDEDGGGGGMVHPFAGFGQEYDDRGFDDDSFDDTVHQPAQDDADTIFGARHAQALLDQNSTRPRISQQLKLLGEDVVEEAQGFRYTVQSQDSPTPAARGS